MYVLEDQTTFTSLNISATLSDVEDGTPPLNGTNILTDPAHDTDTYVHGKAVKKDDGDSKV